tara:strand:+ start:706 stop:1188 length:483 start_codon:yes stop_codon:yes gene_type:complete
MLHDTKQYPYQCVVVLSDKRPIETDAIEHADPVITVTGHSDHYSYLVLMKTLPQYYELLQMIDPIKAHVTAMIVQERLLNQINGQVHLSPVAGYQSLNPAGVSVTVEDMTAEVDGKGTCETAGCNNAAEEEGELCHGCEADLSHRNFWGSGIPMGHHKPS